MRLYVSDLTFREMTFEPGDSVWVKLYASRFCHWWPGKVLGQSFVFFVLITFLCGYCLTITPCFFWKNIEVLTKPVIFEYLFGGVEYKVPVLVRSYT